MHSSTPIRKANDRSEFRQLVSGQLGQENKSVDTRGIGSWLCATWAEMSLRSVETKKTREARNMALKGLQEGVSLTCSVFSIARFANCDCHLYHDPPVDKSTANKRNKIL
jgi:hypothetical protein